MVPDNRRGTMCMEHERFIDIETKIAHLEHTLEQQNEVIYGQEKRIVRLEKAYKRLMERFEGLEGALQVGKPEEEKPPHY